MSSEFVIQANAIGKSYKTHNSKLQQLKSWMLPWRKDLYALTPVLTDISFSIKKGESIGIVGQNGAGKSTLLKILTGTSYPSSGTFSINGNISALLELGMGFHGDFTGRQNTYLAGSIVGLTRSQIDQLMPEIESFAEIGDYFDQPVRTYSSGMQVRLAFSIATAKRPDVLIIDEALAVGDTYFQHKCFGRIRTFRDAGTTLLFVSHDPAAVKSLCNRALLIDKGSIVLDSSPQKVLNYYNALIADKEHNHIEQTDTLASSETRSGNGLAQIASVTLAHPERGPCSIFQVNEPCAIEVTITVHGKIGNITTGLMIRDRVGNDIFGTNTWHLNESSGPVNAGTRLTLAFDIPELRLGIGSYSLTIALHDEQDHLSGNYDWWDNAAVFEIIAGNHPEFAGSVYLPVSAHYKTAEPKPSC
jgi:lipopolysaccharide transport system ATP-binding protein